jgi:hypothetical protein
VRKTPPPSGDTPTRFYRFLKKILLFLSFIQGAHGARDDATGRTRALRGYGTTSRY